MQEVLKFPFVACDNHLPLCQGIGDKYSYMQIAQKTAKRNSKLHFITVRREEHMDLKLTVARMS